MIDYGIFPDAFSYTVLIEGSYKAGNLLMAKKVFDEMVSKGVKPDRLSYTTCITGELKLGSQDPVYVILDGKDSAEEIT
ncbi:Hypothetical predicted protein [Olea europaea subsp. europaea]|uniref:Pentatricopeptide repeat-containing protein n=1 Tax=Olea europaea subsp. europaea TaxID=158383 RepID=A0A8S0R2F6_OLEEU|nr:Hypothetical predicted protein [Olea europaea subsp. europaea]